MITQELEVKQTGNVSRKPYTTTALARKILVDGQSIKAGDATTEEFYCYVYGLLEQFYVEEMREEEEIVEWRYMATFDLDWSDDEDRVAALNQLNAMNRARKTCRLPLIALFASAN